ncbi:MAG: hypothetical protein NWF14_03140 [Candidatus Bathyarchaeota archaeon]|nr:hypothetical protein [Candidatus Bathyarchaeota archaeon]
MEKTRRVNVRKIIRMKSTPEMKREARMRAHVTTTINQMEGIPMLAPSFYGLF